MVIKYKLSPFKEVITIKISILADVVEVSEYVWIFLYLNQL